MKKLFIIIWILALYWCSNIDNMLVKNNISAIEKTVEWKSMEPMIKNGSKILFNSGFYDDKKNEMKLWDIVLYDFKGEKHAIIKSVIARDSDTVELKDNTLFVNKKEVKNSAWKSYNFSTAEQKVMQLYINKENKIPHNSVFILWDNTKVSRDSRKFWAISMDDVLWKIQLKD